MPTLEEIEKLKHDWKVDPVWDIEHTEGFEEHYDELKNFRENYEKQKQDERKKYLQERSEKIGCPGNIQLTKYIESLEIRIERLENL
jgi:hypothetical protein